MINQRTSFPIVLFLLLLITFDALQQKYYIDTFQLSEEPLLFVTLLKSHLIRWSVWLIVSIPFGWIIWREVQSKSLSDFSSKTIIFISTILSVILSIIAISAIFILRNGLEFSSERIVESFVFFVFQKGLTFFMAYGTLILLLNSYSKARKVKAQTVEIINLKKTSEELSKTLLLKDLDEEPHLHIKTGYKIKPIALSEITWIQADDYCVRIHTENRIYSLRKSLKALEEQLRPFRFVRIHRGALLNLQFVDQINFESSTIRLQNESELPLSRSGIKTLKKRIKETSL